MKKHLIYLLSALFLFACSKTNSKNTVTWAVGKDATQAQGRLVKLFMEKNPGLYVKIVEMPESATAQRESYVTYFSARDSSIDVYSIDIIWPSEFASRKWIVPLDKYFSKSMQSAFLNGPIEGCTFGGSIFAVPWYTDAGMLYYRADLLSEADLKPPKTWEELITQSKVLGKKHSINGFVFQAEQYEGLICNFLEYFWSHGAVFFDSNGKVSFTTDKAKSALKTLYDIIHTHKITPEGVLTYKEEESRQVFTSGKAVFLRNWPYVWKISQSNDKSKVKGKVGIAPLPHSTMGKSASALGGWNLAISAFSKNKDNAWKFIEFMTGEEAQKIYAVEGGRLPTRISVYSDKEVLKFAPYFKSFYNVFVNARPRPASPYYSHISDILQIEIHKALTNRQSMDDALKNAENKISRLLEEKNK